MTKRGRRNIFVIISIISTQLSVIFYFLFSDAGLGEGFHYADSNSNNFSDRQVTSYPNQSQRPQHSPFENQTRGKPIHPYNHSALNTTNYEEQEGHNRARTPSPPPPPSNSGFLPTLFPDTSINMPGAGAFSAAALIFGDDFLSGSSFPSSVSTDPLVWLYQIVTW